MDRGKNYISHPNPNLSTWGHKNEQDYYKWVPMLDGRWFIFSEKSKRGIIKSYLHLTLSQTTNFRLFQTEFADDSFKFDEFGTKFFKNVENTVGKGEIACYEQFLLFPQCF